jgi:hypothetical protein
LILSALVVGLAFASLGSSPATATAATAAAPATVSGCQPSGHLVCLGRSDGGHTVHVRVGEKLTVGLSGATLRWSGLAQVGPHLLRRDGSETHRSGGLAASFTAAAKGRTELRASGAPICAPGEACPQFILLWQVKVVVG